MKYLVAVRSGIRCLAAAPGSAFYRDTLPRVELADIVTHFAAAMTAADNRKPIAISPRSGRTYQPGIGPHPEDRAVDLAVSELAQLQPDWPVRVRVCYPGSKQTCDLLLGNPAEWAVEVKMFRPNGDRHGDQGHPLAIPI